MSPKIAVIGTSLRENEHRLPVHPEHLELIPNAQRKHLYFDFGYGAQFGFSDEAIKNIGFSMGDRDELIKTSDIVIIPKPMEADLESIAEGAIIWGWLHFVLYGQLADICIQRKHTVVTWEAMYEDDHSEGRARHTFKANNALAGYAGTLHALGLKGIDGLYGKPSKVAVIGHGYAGRAAIQALQGRGFDDITVYSKRINTDINDCMDYVIYKQIAKDEQHGTVIIETDHSQNPLWAELKSMDIIINCGGQDPENPLMYVPKNHEPEFDHDCLIIDISCDPGMGFSFIKTTTFDHPTYQFGKITICAVDHSPGYLWDAATWQISKEVIRFLPNIMAGMKTIQSNAVLNNAIEIQTGVITNPKIITYQNRSKVYPHSVKN